MSDKHEDLLSQVNEGRMASVLLNWLQPVFTQIEQDLVNGLKANFRAGTYTELILACSVAQLCAIDDLKTKIKGIAVRGDDAHARLNPQPIEDDPYGERE